MKNLILATTSGYSYSQLYPFLRSLRETSFSGDLVLFAANTDRKTIAQLRADGVIVIPFFYPYGKCYKLRNPLYRIWPAIRKTITSTKNAGTIARFCGPFQNLSILRYFLYRKYLLSTKGRYQYIFLTDLRDVYFQDDPFRRIGPGELRVFLEEPWLRQGADVNSSRWLRELFGEEIVQELADTTLICSGTTLGDYENMMAYLDAFLLSLRNAKSIMRMGKDQGIHNYLIYKNLLRNVTKCPNRSSEILTMGLISPQESLPKDRDGRFLDDQGRLYSVVHQFDRHDGLREEILLRYRAPGS